MDRYKETFETWNKVALLYQEKFMTLTMYDESYEIFCKLIGNSNAKILDAGCGPGNISRYILSKYPGYKIDGIDIAPNMIELAKVNNPAAEFMVMDLRDISQLNKKYNGIICGFGLPYLSESEAKSFIDECCNLLLEDGVLYLSFVEGDPERSGFKTASTGDRTFFNYFNMDHLIDVLKNAGFESPMKLKVDFKRSESEIENHTILLAKKK
ncbi:MAG: class I SAM-dependent methyltransferase [Bacteroidia bacterium]|nr:class I SAM-dependent methyltransferase [Bacteroidota bacterium]MBP6426567.1 class I SAM-dependent methyltransferase [Bacteroidia bacterium]MBP6656451.1 class I SAM-dependent methyltransferase [Bacteroidia bacterium]